MLRILWVALLICPVMADELGPVLDRLATLETRLDKMHDEIHEGNLPAQAGGDSAKPAVDLSNIVEKLNELQKRLTALEEKSPEGRVTAVAAQQDLSPKKEGLDLGARSGEDDDVDAILKSLEMSATADAKTLAESKAILKAEQSAPTLASNDFEAQYNEAMGLLDKENFTAAVSAFQYCLKTYPNPKNDSRVLYQLGRSYYGCKDFGKAKKTFAEAYRKNPKGPMAADSLFQLAKIFVQDNDTKKACTTVREIERKFAPLEKDLEGKLKALKKEAKC